MKTRFEQEREAHLPRNLSEAQIASLQSQAKPFSGQSYAGLILPAAGDSLSLWYEVAQSLTGAGWKMVGKTHPLSIGNPPADIAFAADPNVTLLIRQPSSRTEDDAAVRLAKALISFGIATAANRDTDPLSGSYSPGTIIVEIGLKAQ